MLGKYGFQDFIEDRVIEAAFYIYETKATVREAAKKFGVSKTTIHKDVTERLLQIDALLAEDVRTVLDEHIQDRSVKGGLAAQKKAAEKRFLN